MARPASGMDVSGKAKEVLSKARTVGELRQAQAVIFPLEFGFSMEQTASALGISKGWACQLRQQFIRSNGACIWRNTTRGGRRRENMSYEEEAVFLAPFF
ncbi:MAG: winged helix-turn-helix domain-containing protein, partial [Nitrospirota bacterium]